MIIKSYVSTRRKARGSKLVALKTGDRTRWLTTCKLPTVVLAYKQPFSAEFGPQAGDATLGVKWYSVLGKVSCHLRNYTR